MSEPIHESLPAPKAQDLSFRPLGEGVLIRPIQPDEKTSGGILLPQQAKDKPQSGEVLAVGAGRQTEAGTRLPMSVRVGDKVLFGPYDGADVKHQGEELKLIAESKLLAVVG